MLQVHNSKVLHGISRYIILVDHSPSTQHFTSRNRFTVSFREHTDAGAKTRQQHAHLGSEILTSDLLLVRRHLSYSSIYI